MINFFTATVRVWVAIIALSACVFTGCDEEQLPSSPAPVQTLGVGRYTNGPVPFEQAKKMADRCTEAMKADDPEDAQIKYEVNTAIVELLACYDSQNRVAAAENLGELRKKQACDALIIAADDPVPTVQIATIDALAWIGDKTTALPVAKKLSAPQARVRLAAAKAMARLGDKKTANELYMAFRDKDAAVRAQAVRSVGILRSESSVKPLSAVLARDPSANVRSAAAGALGQTGSDMAFTPLVKALSDQNSHVRYLAIGALKQLGDKRAIEYIAPLKRDPDPAVRKMADNAISILSQKSE